MTPEEIVKHLTATIASREDCLSLALDRGCGKVMKLEKWMLVEMLAKLMQLRNEGTVDKVDGEHNYPGKRTGWSDLWWRVHEEEHWLEMKTLVLCKDPRRAEPEEVRKDLEKASRLRSIGIFHHLTIVFPVGPDEKRFSNLRTELDGIYRQGQMTSGEYWTYPLSQQRFLLATLRSKMTT